MRFPAVQVGLFTLAFASAYPLLRLLPDTECSFLHYQYVGETTGGSEYCGSGAAPFIDLARLSFPVTMELVPAHAPLEIGQPSFFILTLKTSGGKPILPWELAVVHTEKIHLFVVDPTLEDYHHVHPEPVGNTGQYGFAFTPHRSGNYKIFAEWVPLASKSIVIAEATFEVAGDGDKAPSHHVAFTSNVGDYRLELSFPGPKLLLGRDNAITLTITRLGKNAPVILEEIMGAYAHMVAFDERRNGFAHMHPLDNGVGLGTPQAKFSFSLNTNLPGYYKVWAQLKIEGHDVFAPFAVRVDSIDRSS